MNEVWRVPSDDGTGEIVEIEPVIVVTSGAARDLIIAAIRDDLGLRFDDDQLFEGYINPELADAIIERLQQQRIPGAT